VIEAEQFYKALRVSGNQYGPRFQNVSSLWRRASNLETRWRPSMGRSPCLHASQLDS
jgi:hypothetical protein